MNRLQTIAARMRGAAEDLRAAVDANDLMATSGTLAIGAGVWMLHSFALSLIFCGSFLCLAGAYGAHRAASPRKGKDS